MRVLIIEDSIDLRFLMKQYLESEGLEILTAANGLDALNLLNSSDTSAEQLPHVILLDLMMPVMDGFQFRQEQMNSPYLNKIPVVVMTAGRPNAAEAERLGSCEFLHKPIDIDDLIAVLNQLSSKATPQENLSGAII